jgi:hypothetical protein
MPFGDTDMLTLRTPFADDLAAQLARAAYRVALKHGVEGSWIELELEMWDVLAHTLDGCEQQRSHDMGPSELQSAARRRPK